MDEYWIDNIWLWADKNGIFNRKWINGGMNYEDNDIAFGEFNDCYIVPGWRGLIKNKKDFINIKELILDRYDLKELPKEIGKLDKLIALELRENSLEYLPKEIGQLVNLTYLNLWFNSLKSIPREIGYLYKLQDLNLSYNRINSLPKEIGKLTNLTSLSLTNNNLQKLPEEITQLKKLTWLNISGNDNLVLTTQQKKWIDFLVLNNACHGPYGKIY